MREYEYIILGGGVAGGYAIRELVDHGAGHGEVAVISSDDQPPYERPPLSKKFLLGEKQAADILINPPEYYKEHGVDLRLRTEIWRIDFHRRCLFAKSGEEFGFRKLLLATGSRVNTLDLPGSDLDNLFYLRWLDDAQRIRDAAERGGPAVVIGGGYIGMEVAAHLAQRGIETTLVVSGDRLLPRLFTGEMSAFFVHYYRNRRVRIECNARIAAFSGDGRIETATLDSGKMLPASFAVAGIGVTPALDLYKNTCVHIDGGVHVNEYLETRAPDVFAAGDIAAFLDPVDGTRRRLEHWDNAMQQGACAGRSMIAGRTHYDHVSYFFSDVFDLSWEFWGDTEGAGEPVYRGDVWSGSFSAWWLKDSRLIGAFVMNRPEAERELAPRWIHERKEFAAGELESDDTFSTVSAETR